MGRGNVCVFGEYEGLYFADRCYLDFYIPVDGEADDGKFYYEIDDIDDYAYSYHLSEMYYEDFVNDFIYQFKKKFKSFTETGDTYGAILKNNLFTIEIEDNMWSYAVKLIQKEDDYDNHLEGLQKKHYENYLKGIRDVLLDLFPSIGTYRGAWMSGTLTREDLAIA